LKTQGINQTIFFDAAPREVFDLLTNKARYEAFSGDKVEISTEIKGAFSAFSGYCTGYNIELIEGKK